jgi:hypothetical protein
MTVYNPLRELPTAADYRPGGVLVLFGELFGRGYANGIVEEARRAGMTIIGTTVGRRDSDGTLRKLNAEELSAAEELLGGSIINIPLEAGFDMESGDGGPSPVEQLKGARPDQWETIRLDWEAIEKSRLAGVARFTANLAQVVSELEKIVPSGSNFLFAHVMAGGIPRARVFMPVMNRVFKGQGERYLPSASFWESDLGKLCKLGFEEVSADTFTHLLEATAPIRDRVGSSGKKVSYVAYGYHGCEVLINGAYRWQSYHPYLPGWAKIKLEEAAIAAWGKGITATVFNCPEIQTNSSALFLGVEISLYPLITALHREGGGAVADSVKAECRALLKDGVTIDAMLARAEEYLSSPVMKGFGDYSQWPHHTTKEQMELMLTAANELFDMSSNPKEVVCAVLSKWVFSAVGRLMLDTSWEPGGPVYWLNHDIIARRLVT